MGNERAKTRRDQGMMSPALRRFYQEMLEKQLPPAPDAFPFSDRAWERLRFQGMRMKDFIGQGFLKNLPADISEGWREWQREMHWQTYKALCAAHGNGLPWVICQIEPQWTGLFQRQRPRRPKGSALFDDLPPDQRAKAQEIFAQICDQSFWPASDWRRPLLAGVARRLARNPYNRSSHWGKKMRRRKGGKHTQRRYREEGWHPLASVRKAWGLTAAGPRGSATASPPLGPKL